MNRSGTEPMLLRARWAMELKRLSLLCTAGFLLLAFAPFTSWATPIILQAGDLQLAVRKENGGIFLASLRDSRTGQDLVGTNPLPLFEVVLRRAGSADEIRIQADSGWAETRVRSGKRVLELNWTRSGNRNLAGLTIAARAKADRADSQLRWEFQILNRNTNWGVWNVVFPQVALADLGPDAAVFFPRGPGEVQRGVWDRSFSYQGTYPDGWCSMQFMAAYREGEKSTGLYVGLHDPHASTKQLALQRDDKTHALRLCFTHPAPDMGAPAQGFVLEGSAVWRLLRGDWFDAARVYRDWAQKEALWWPRLGRNGRSDTPKWMRELSVWAMTGGAPSECVDSVKAFRDFMGLPAGFHWYSWHQIPFDNDYPHYFPPKSGFEDGVATLRSAGVRVMPYINGRLWDSHDQGTNDFQFTRVALQAVTKNGDGSPILESYGSKEANGDPVRLGVMCPTTPLWQSTVSNIVLRLLRGYGTSGVYVDQVAAAAPKLCMDPRHGHPLGGGHWWTEGYWKMLEAIRAAKPADSMLTTECNAEPFIRWFDGYLTWHWQHDGQVPAFPAVYGGTIQMFGRAYRGGATKDLALRMKAGQQLVFGEQLGWLDPSLIKEPENAAFFRTLATFRNNLSRYFYAGEMARPPKLDGDVPRVRADWQWSGEWWVSTDAVLTGAWTLPRERRTLLLFVNVSDKPVRATVRTDASWGPITKPFTIAPAGSNPMSAKAKAGGGMLDAAHQFPPLNAEAWEMTW